MKIPSVFVSVKLLADRQTDENKVKSTLVGTGNKEIKIENNNKTLHGYMVYWLL